MKTRGAFFVKIIRLKSWFNPQHPQSGKSFASKLGNALIDVKAWIGFDLQIFSSDLNIKSWRIYIKSFTRNIYTTHQINCLVWYIAAQMATAAPALVLHPLETCLLWLLFFRSGTKEELQDYYQACKSSQETYCADTYKKLHALRIVVEGPYRHSEDSNPHYRRYFGFSHVEAWRKYLACFVSED